LRRVSNPLFGPVLIFQVAIKQIKSTSNAIKGAFACCSGLTKET